MTLAVLIIMFALTVSIIGLNWRSGGRETEPALPAVVLRSNELELYRPGQPRRQEWNVGAAPVKQAQNNLLGARIAACVRNILDPDWDLKQMCAQQGQHFSYLTLTLNETGFLIRVYIRERKQPIEYRYRYDHIVETTTGLRIESPARRKLVYDKAMSCLADRMPGARLSGGRIS